MDHNLGETHLTAEQQDAFDNFIVDASSRIREVLKIEEKIVDDNVNFLTWIVGIASGGFLLFLTKLKELAEKALPDSTFVRNCFILTLLSFLAVILCSLLFRLLYKHHLYRLGIDEAAYNAQEAHLKSISKGVIKDWKGEETNKSDYVELFAGMLMKRYLPKQQIDNWLAAMEESKWKVNLSKTMYWTAVLAFLAQYCLMIYAFWRAYQ